MGLFSKIASGIKKVATVITKNPIVSTVGKLVAPRIYNAVSMAAGVAAKAVGVVEKAGTAVTPAPVKAPAATTVKVAAPSVKSTSTLDKSAVYNANTETIRTAYKKG